MTADTTAIDSALFTLCRVERRIPSYTVYHMGVYNDPRVIVTVPAAYVDGDPNAGWDDTTKALYAEVTAIFAGWRVVDNGINDDGTGEYFIFAC